MTAHVPHVLVVSPHAPRASIIGQGLCEAGCTRVTHLRGLENVLRRIVDVDPDVIFLDVGTPEPALLEQVLEVVRCVRRPVAIFADRSDTWMIAAAADSGVGAYVVDGLRKERVKAILDTAMSRFRVFQRMSDELERTKRQLEERKVIERAKGILMRERSLSEADAYGLLRKAAMNENRRLAEVARCVVKAASPVK